MTQIHPRTTRFVHLARSRKEEPEFMGVTSLKRSSLEGQAKGFLDRCPWMIFGGSRGGGKSLRAHENESKRERGVANG